MNTTVKYIMLTALRDWLFFVILIATAAAIFLSNFLGSTVMIEQAEMEATFTGATTRVVLITGLIVFVCFHVRRAFENKEIELMLSRPISRVQFIISYWLGFCLVSTIIISFIAAYLAFFTGSLHAAGFAVWVVSLIFETFIVLAFAIFASIILSSSVSSVLLCFGFYITSRLIGFFGYILEKHVATDFASFEFYSQKVIWVSSFVLPRLDLYAKTDWLVYGINFTSFDHLLPLVQAFIYVPLLLTFAILDFRKKQF